MVCTDSHVVIKEWVTKKQLRYTIDAKINKLKSIWIKKPPPSAFGINIEHISTFALTTTKNNLLYHPSLENPPTTLHMKLPPKVKSY